jgi:hypothetical protein
VGATDTPEYHPAVASILRAFNIDIFQLEKLLIPYEGKFYHLVFVLIADQKFAAIAGNMMATGAHYSNLV